MVLSLIVGLLALGAAVLTGLIGYFIDRSAEAQGSETTTSAGPRTDLNSEIKSGPDR